MSKEQFVAVVVVGVVLGVAVAFFAAPVLEWVGVVMEQLWAAFLTM